MKNKAKPLFSYIITENHKIINFFGLKLSVRNNANLIKDKKIQNSYDLKPLINAKTLVVFLIPDKNAVNGGIQSIYSICKYTRKLNNESTCVISTVPGKYTYSHNDCFKNSEKVYRWEQIIKCLNNQQVILNIPEYFMDKFYETIKKSDKKKLKNLKNLQINILNQNINMMPDENKIIQIKENITQNITQTIAHERYATQDVANKWQIPTHYLSVHIDLSEYKPIQFEEKEKIITLSPDVNEYRENIIKILQTEMPDFKLVTVENMTFSEYMDLISKSYFTITFGEGFDGYFGQPNWVGSLGLSVYNDKFFPDKTWCNLKNVYNSYEDLQQNIVSDLKEYLNNKNLYYETINKTLVELNKIYDVNKYEDNIVRFYNQKYDFYPSKEKN